MSRRITFTTDEQNISREKAIQPNMDDLIETLLEALLAEGTQIADDHQIRVTVIQDSVTEEVLTDQTGSSKVSHRRSTLILNLPQTTVEKEATVGNVAAGPKSDERLVKLVAIVLKRIDRLVFDSFLIELSKESGKQVGKSLVALALILIALFFFWFLPVVMR